jgi:spore germination protein YaaH
MVDSGTDSRLRYDLLTTITFFSMRYASDGSIDTSAADKGYQAYLSSIATTIIEHAHAAGVRTEIAVSFSSDPDTNHAFFADSAARQKAVSQTVALMTTRGADGVNLDVERLYGADFPAYASFAAQLRTAVRAWNPFGQVSVATNGNTSGAEMAAAALAAGASRAFLMGYSYRTAGTSPTGSIDPLVRPDGLDLTDSLDLYAANGVPLSKVLLGLPYYGRTWPTVSDALHAARNTAVSGCSFSPATPTVAQVPGILGGSTVQLDSAEQSAWFARYDTTNQTWCETYFDSPATLSAKFGLVFSRGLAGAGLWALGYDGSRTDYWAAIASTFAPPATTYHALPPTRILDTRAGLGAGRLRMGLPASFAVAGRGGVPATGAVAVTGNLTVVGQTGAGYVSLGPTEVTSPTTSTINVPLGDIRANGVTVQLGSGRLWAVYRAARSSDTTQLLFDVTGYYTK